MQLCSRQVNEQKRAVMIMHTCCHGAGPIPRPGRSWVADQRSGAAGASRPTFFVHFARVCEVSATGDARV